MAEKVLARIHADRNLIANYSQHAPGSGLRIHGRFSFVAPAGCSVGSLHPFLAVDHRIPKLVLGMQENMLCILVLSDVLDDPHILLDFPSRVFHGEETGPNPASTPVSTDDAKLALSRFSVFLLI